MATLLPIQTSSASLPRLIINSINSTSFISIKASNSSTDSSVLAHSDHLSVGGGSKEERFIEQQRFGWAEASTSKADGLGSRRESLKRIRVQKNTILGNEFRKSKITRRGYSTLVQEVIPPSNQSGHSLPSYSSKQQPSPGNTQSIKPEKKSFFETIKEKVDLKGKGKGKAVPVPKVERRLDELNTLLRHPTLYNPVLCPRNPIVLCHGLYGFDVRGPAFFRMHYWGDLLRIFRGVVKAEVHVTAVPGTGSIKQRSHSLHQGLLATPEIQGRDLNFIAHSMGGLDARYLFSNILDETKKDYNPVSLTTLSTPHRGSEFMAWCRANIGIGTDFDETSSIAARATHNESSIPLPFSLKNPVLSRAQVNEMKKAAEARKEERRAIEEIRKNGGATVGNVPGLPYSLSTSLSSYLLDLLDSPAYANLTPSFLEDVFNPSTPDVPSISYYSIAARTPKISVLHPLFLPKLVLDGAEEARQKRGIFREEVGNDGLVSIESAKWGTFLGVLEGCDHWVLRGSAGLIEEAKTAGRIDLEESEKKKLESEGGTGKVKSWMWEDVYSKIGRSSKAETKSTSIEEKVEGKEEKLDSDERGIASLASWITKRLPNHPTGEALPNTIILPPPNTATIINNNQNRLLYGATMGNGLDEDKFNLERMCLAIARKLHNDGF